ncbi:MAG: hypothetical protein AAF264_02565 [Pseudomonadota bacterium]
MVDEVPRDMAIRSGAGSTDVLPFAPAEAALDDEHVEPAFPLPPAPSALAPPALEEARGGAATDPLHALLAAQTTALGRRSTVETAWAVGRLMLDRGADASASEDPEIVDAIAAVGMTLKRYEHLLLVSLPPGSAR